MHDLVIQPARQTGQPDVLWIANCDKDGALVAARLASATSRIAAGRPQQIMVDRFTDPSFPESIGNRLASYYNQAEDSHLMRDDIVVVSSVHRAALYIAESLHAAVLPLQILSFSRSLTDVTQSPWQSIVGADFDSAHLWQWNKITQPNDFPQGYRERLQRANKLVLVRSLDDQADSPLLGRLNEGFFNATLPRLHPRRWESLRKSLDLDANHFPQLRQWEWGLPDATVVATRQFWLSLGKPESDFHIIEASTIGLFHSVPSLWKSYLAKNHAEVSGISLNAYWIAHPGYERMAGIIPIPFYHFRTVKEIARAHFSNCRSYPASRLTAFVNNSGGAHDVEDARAMLTALSMENQVWFSIGDDSPDAPCRDSLNMEILKPFAKVAQQWASAPNQNLRWQALSIDEVERVFAQTDR